MEFVVGIVCGVILSFIFGFGPVFFGLIQNSIQYGFRKSMYFVLGVLLSDLLMVLLMLTVLSGIDMNAVLRNAVVATVCGVLLVGLGVMSFRRKVAKPRRRNERMQEIERIKQQEIERIKQNDRIPLGVGLFLHGLSLNLLNPLAWLYWVSVVSFLSAEIELGASERYIFFAGLLSGSFTCDTLKCRLASLMQRWFTPGVMVWLNRVVGVCLMAFGAYLIVSMAMHRRNPANDAIEPSIQNTRIIQNVHQRIRRDTAQKAAEADTVCLYPLADSAAPLQRTDTLTAPSSNKTM